MIRNILILGVAVGLASCNSGPQSPTASSTTSTSGGADTVDGKLWTTAQYADRHTCPSENCGVVGRLGFREAATPLETKDGWVRITKVYDANCENGKSVYVDKGNAECVKSNGITDNKFAEWVRADQLSETRPRDPADKATDTEQVVKNSDDFNLYHEAFAKVAYQLISDGRCTVADFEEQGGWTKSVNRRDEPVYFIYCGGMTAASKVYMNAKTATVI